jgi:hypothetical protein
MTSRCRIWTSRWRRQIEPSGSRSPTSNRWSPPSTKYSTTPLYLDYIGRVNVDLGRWARPHAEDGWITIDGPVIDAATQIHDRTVELNFVHVAELRLKLVDFADALAADDASW